MQIYLHLSCLLYYQPWYQFNINREHVSLMVQYANDL